MHNLGTAQLAESDEYQDVTLRIHTRRGSIPVQIVLNGERQTREQVGAQVLEAFNYFVESPVFDAAQKPCTCTLGICVCPR